MSAKETYVKVEIELPAAIVNFLRDMEKFMGGSMEKYLQQSIVCAFEADLDSMDVFIAHRGDVAKKYGLAEALKDFGVAIPEYWYTDP